MGEPKPRKEPPGRPLWNVRCTNRRCGYAYDQFNAKKPERSCRQCGAKTRVTHLAKLQADIEKALGVRDIPRRMLSKPPRGQQMLKVRHGG